MEKAFKLLNLAMSALMVVAGLASSIFFLFFAKELEWWKIVFTALVFAVGAFDLRKYYKQKTGI